jgi:hypothetical protein
LWKECWNVLSEEFSDNVRQSVNETLLRLEELELNAIENNDRRIQLEVVKYRNKIRGGEIERHQVDVKGDINVVLNWGDGDNTI